MTRHQGGLIAAYSRAFTGEISVRPELLTAENDASR